jgi:thymidylate kinase
MKTDLFVITGSEGVGKSTLVPELKNLLGDKFVVYDYDEVLRPYDLTDSWAEEVLTKVCEHVLENKNHHQTTVLAGLIRPYQLQKVAQKFNMTNIKLLLLDISVEEQTKRLTERKGKINLKGENEELIAFREYIKESEYDYQILEATDMKVADIVRKIEKWILND